MIACISGTIYISPTTTLYNVLYIPTFHANLIEVTKLTSNNDCSINFFSNSWHILQNHSQQTIGTTRLQRGLYVIDHCGASSTCNSAISNSFELRHLRLGHISHFGMQTLAKQFPLIPCKNQMNPCDSCHYAKQKKLLFPHNITHIYAPFALLHADLWGPFATESILVHKYFLTLVDDFSRFTWVVFLINKSETKQSIIRFIASVENHFNTILKCYRSDNGSEFVTLSEFFLSKGIYHKKILCGNPPTKWGGGTKA